MKQARQADFGTVDLVVFDLDGTLVDSREDIARAVNQGILSVGGKALPGKDIIPHIGRPIVDTFMDLLPVELKHMAEGAVDTFRQYFFQHCAETSRLYPGVSGCLETLQAVSRAVATTKMTFMAEKVLEEMGIAHHFDLVQGSDGIPHKPDPSVLSRVLARPGPRTLKNSSGRLDAVRLASSPRTTTPRSWIRCSAWRSPLAGLKVGKRKHRSFAS